MTIETTRSTTAVTSAPPTTTGRPPRGRPWPLILLELLIAASATYGGVGLMWHNAIHMPNEWLQGTPFTSWVLPGVLLLLVVTAPMAIAAWLELRHSPWSTVGSVAAGAALIGWIAAELFIMQRYNVLQPVTLCCGLAVVLGALWAHRNRPTLLPHIGQRRLSERFPANAQDSQARPGTPAAGTNELADIDHDQPES